MLHRCVTTLMANGPGFGFSWVKCNMVLSDAKYTDIGVPLFFVPRIYAFSGKVSHTMAFVTSVVQLWLERDNLNVTLIDDILTPIALPL